MTAPHDEQTSEEIERALEIGPPDFLLGYDFDAENGQGASDEFRQIAEQNSSWPGESKGFEADLAEIEAGLNLMYNAANDNLLGSLRSECVAALHRLRLRLRAR